ncbi:MAG TPA: winged helix DNA-binding domain-containing protein [Propionibacteriaceae bacterium]|nr:winged helix DNA-binding domain-containing protein [Propionibacteriaceae bacterium]
MPDRPVQLSWDQVLAFRAERHHLSERTPAGAALAVLRSLCGVRAQLPTTAELSLWARVDALSSGWVTEGLHDRTLVKTWVRNRAHVIPADDLALYVAALHPRPEGPGDGWLRLRGVTRQQYEAIVAAVPRVLDDWPRTREQLAEGVTALAGADLRDAVMFSWGGVLKQSARSGDLCFGPPTGREVTFVRPDVWLGSALDADPDAAGRELVRRYFAAYGPSTAVDFGHWIEDPARARAFVRAAASDLAPVDIEGHRALALRTDLDSLTADRRPSGVRLLPGFDQYVTGTQPRAAFVPPDAARRVFGQQGSVAPVLLVAGRAAGVWSHERRGEVVGVRVQPFGPLDAATVTALEDEATRLAAFLGGAPELVVEA